MYIDKPDLIWSIASKCFWDIFLTDSLASWINCHMWTGRVSPFVLKLQNSPSLVVPVLEDKAIIKKFLSNILYCRLQRINYKVYLYQPTTFRPFSVIFRLISEFNSRTCLSFRVWQGTNFTGRAYGLQFLFSSEIMITST